MEQNELFPEDKNQESENGLNGSNNTNENKNTDSGSLITESAENRLSVYNDEQNQDSNIIYTELDGFDREDKLKNLRLTLAILGIIGSLLGWILGVFIFIPILVIALIIIFKTPKDEPKSKAAVLLATAASISIILGIFYIFSFIVSLFSIGGSAMIIGLYIVQFFVGITVFIMSIIGTILAFIEYSK